MSAFAVQVHRDNKKDITVELVENDYHRALEVEDSYNPDGTELEKQNDAIRALVEKKHPSLKKQEYAFTLPLFF